MTSPAWAWRVLVLEKVVSVRDLKKVVLGMLYKDGAEPRITLARRPTRLALSGAEVFTKYSLNCSLMQDLMR